METLLARLHVSVTSNENGALLLCLDGGEKNDNHSRQQATSKCRFLAKSSKFQKWNLTQFLSRNDLLLFSPRHINEPVPHLPSEHTHFGQSPETSRCRLTRVRACACARVSRVTRRVDLRRAAGMTTPPEQWHVSRRRPVFYIITLCMQTGVWIMDESRAKQFN